MSKKNGLKMKHNVQNTQYNVKNNLKTLSPIGDFTNI